MSAPPFSHLDRAGRARMVDVSAKPVTRRVAEASCRVVLSAATAARLAELPKGDAVAVARLAGIQGAKRAGELVPLAHPLPLDQVEVEVEPAAGGVAIRSRVVATARTGAEIEALTACAAAALALYDMVKAVERGAVITDLRLEAKSGGARGDYRRADAGRGEPAPPRREPARKASTTRKAKATRKAPER
jgi:cyclic pyranopterin phosphate synthase